MLISTEFTLRKLSALRLVQARSSWHSACVGLERTRPTSAIWSNALEDRVGANR